MDIVGFRAAILLGSDVQHKVASVPLYCVAGSTKVDIVRIMMFIMCTCVNAGDSKTASQQ